MNVRRALEHSIHGVAVVFLAGVAANVFNDSGAAVVLGLALFVPVLLFVAKDAVMARWQYQSAHWDGLDTVVHVALALVCGGLFAVLCAAWSGYAPGRQASDFWVRFNLGWAGVWLLGMLALAGGAWLDWRQSRALANWVFPPRIAAEVRKVYPFLDAAQIDALIEGLRAFMTLLRRDGRGHAMPSCGVDAAWHAYVLMTRDYARFCRAVNGGMIHHAPAGPGHERTLYRTWLACCRAEGLDPELPTRLPALFYFDSRFGIPCNGGFAVENGCYPCDPEFGKSPERWLRELQARDPATLDANPDAALLEALRSNLFAKAWLRVTYEDAVFPLIDEIERHPGLFKALFATPAAVVAWRARLRKRRSEGGCGGGGCGGCGGGCGGC